ncbi:hypothetical protein DM02DRAFT_316976 [Periconia macrospinosa]|uniref:Uncharacterized protein n=1 Tax=Periconia macrospinosa TaxID=97972 RepID=A0A2V1DUY5_9PLEO|nr:hypothetical protein DM02DRAFT_316976 [Periconia macrospinosa]
MASRTQTPTTRARLTFLELIVSCSSSSSAYPMSSFHVVPPGGFRCENCYLTPTKSWLARLCLVAESSRLRR